MVNGQATLVVSGDTVIQYASAIIDVVGGAVAVNVDALGDLVVTMLTDGNVEIMSPEHSEDGVYTNQWQELEMWKAGTTYGWSSVHGFMKLEDVSVEEIKLALQKNGAEELVDVLNQAIEHSNNTAVFSEEVAHEPDFVVFHDEFAALEEATKRYKLPEIENVENEIDDGTTPVVTSVFSSTGNLGKGEALLQSSEELSERTLESQIHDVFALHGHDVTYDPLGSTLVFLSDGKVVFSGDIEKVLAGIVMTIDLSGADVNLVLRPREVKNITPEGDLFIIGGKGDVVDLNGKWTSEAGKEYTISQSADVSVFTSPELELR